VPGISAAFDLLSHVLFEAGDFVLTPAPCYRNFENDFWVRGLVNVEMVETNGNGELSVEQFEKAYQKVTAKKKVKIFF
jgi:DNA-binding transcriptional MocR family regulator